MALRIDRNAPQQAPRAQAAGTRPPAAQPAPVPQASFERARSLGGPELQSAARHVPLPSITPGQAVASETVKGSAAPNAKINDNSKVESTIHVDGDLDIEKLSVNLDIAHSYRGDLVVTLTSPSGKSAVLSNREGGSADDIKGRFDPAAFQGEPSKGDWKLTVEDKANGDTGTLKAWDLEITGTPKAPPPPPGPAPQVIEKSVTPNAAIEDNKTVTSTIDVAEDVDVSKLQLDLDIKHSYRGDLVVKVTSPSGKTVTVSDRQGGSADDIKGSFDLSAFAGEKAKGQWKLEVSDVASGDTGTLNSWGLKITPKGSEPPPPPPPAGEDSDPMTHIRYFASDELKGRDSPGPDFDKASAHVRDYLQKYGLQGPNASDAQSPYYQTFNEYSFGPGASAQQTAGGKKQFNAEHFEKEFYLDDTLSKSDLKLLNKKYEESATAQGQRPVQGTGPDGLRSVDDLKALATPTGQTQNVMGLLPGTGPHKNEVIVIMAHLDHEGVQGGQVYNGADDNASGSAVTMASIPALVEAQKRGELDRSILFLWTTSEEDGDVGSSYFVNHPIPGLGTKEITGVVNMDMVGRWDDQRLSVMDTTKGKPNYLRDVVNQANAQMADPFDKLNHDIDGYYTRQDGYAFSSKGEDVLMLFEGLSNPNGGGDLNPDYHEPTDDVDKIIEDNGGNKPRRVTDLLVNIAKLASNHAAAAAQQQSTVDWQ